MKPLLLGFVGALLAALVISGVWLAYDTRRKAVIAYDVVQQAIRAQQQAQPQPQAPPVAAQPAPVK